MSQQILREEVATNILPKVWRQVEGTGDTSSNEYKLLARIVAKPPRKFTIGTWIKFLGLKYDTQWAHKLEKVKEKQRQASKQQQADPEVRLAQSLRMKEYYLHNPQKGGKRKQPPADPTTESDGYDSCDDNPHNQTDGCEKMNKPQPI